MDAFIRQKVVILFTGLNVEPGKIYFSPFKTIPLTNLTTLFSTHTIPNQGKTVMGIFEIETQHYIFWKPSRQIVSEALN